MRTLLWGVSIWFAATTAAAGGGELANLAEDARPAFRPVDEADVAKAGSAVEAAKSQLEAYLARDASRAAAWKAYLRLSSLEEELTRGTAADVAALSDIRALLAANHEGLELPPFRRLRAAIDEYLLTLQAFRAPPTREEFERRIDDLISLLSRWETDPDDAAHLAISRHLAWLHAKGQAPSLVRELQARLSAPNAFVYVAAQVIAAATQEEVDRNTEINSREDDQFTFGAGRLQGRAAAFPVPGADGRGQLEIRFSGTLRTRVTTVQDSVRVYTHGWAPVVARKPVILTEGGFVPQPTCSRVCYNNFVDCIKTTLKGRVADAIVSKLAGVYINATEEEIEYDAARDAEREFNQEFDEDAADDLEQGNKDFQEKFRKPLLRQGMYPRRLEFRTDDESLQVVMLQDGGGRLAAPGAPQAPAAGTDIGVQLHESFLNNYGAAALAGKFYTVEEFEAMLQDAMQDLGLDELAEEEDNDEAPPGDIGILFDALEPVQAQFAGGVATIIVRGERYVYEDRVYPPMNIIIRYRVEIDQGRLRATLVGEPEYAPPPGVRGLRVAALRRILEAHITPRIEPEVVAGEIRLPDTDGEDELGPLAFHHIAADKAWLTIALRRRDQTRVTLPRLGDRFFLPSQSARAGRPHIGAARSSRPAR
ncbi:MAG: hypothetical protein KY475_01125 [Planctomycetes bacterium]|nr:hypothetical protein [Planctomycetota bacterium]